MSADIYKKGGDMILTSTLKQCLTCEKTIRGRSDKKFCNDFCRNTFNNRQKHEGNPHIKTINAILVRNHKILSGLLPEGEESLRVHRTRLMLEGFQFDYFTHIVRGRNGKFTYFCYDHGYLSVDEQLLTIVRKKVA